MAFLSHDELLGYLQGKKYFGVYVIDAQTRDAYNLGIFARKEDAEKYLDMLKSKYGQDAQCDPNEQMKWIEEIFHRRIGYPLPLPLNQALPKLLKMDGEEVEDEIYSYLESFNAECDGICFYDAATDSETLHIYELSFHWNGGFSRHWFSYVTSG